MDEERECPDCGATGSSQCAPSCHSQTDTDPITDVFDGIARLAIAKGEAPIKGKIWKTQFGPKNRWTVAVNGFNEKRPVFCVDPHDGHTMLDPFHAMIWWNGWPAGYVGPFEGTMVAHPTGASEERFLEDLKQEIASLAAS